VHRFLKLTLTAPGVISLSETRQQARQVATSLPTITRTNSARNVTLSSKVEELKQSVPQNPRTWMSLDISRNRRTTTSSLAIVPDTTRCAPLLARRVVSFVACPPTQSGASELPRAMSWFSCLHPRTVVRAPSRRQALPRVQSLGIMEGQDDVVLEKPFCLGKIVSG
jgi:hypothetical protein